MDDMGKYYKMPTFEFFCEHLSREQAKLIHMDALPSSKNQALIAQSSKGKGKNKKKPKVELSSGSEFPSKLKKKNTQKSIPPPSSNSGDSSSKKGEPYSFCGKTKHDEFHCFKRLEAL